MRALWTILLCLVLAGTYFYNTNWFQSFFLHERFYEDICNIPFDVTQRGESISIPLKYKFKTCYSLAITVPDKDLFHDGNVGDGILKYRFLSRGRVIAEGYTRAPNDRHLMFYHGVTMINILVFDLPFPGTGNDLTLELEVKEPFEFLEPFAGKTTCQIEPDYIASFGKCYNEDLRMKY